MNAYAFSESIYRYAREHKFFNHYTGILNLQALERLAHLSGDAHHRALLREDLAPFLNYLEDWRGACNLSNYRIGGNGAAAACYHGFLPELKPLLAAEADSYFKAPRDPAGILAMPSKQEQEAIWIDAAWASVPFNLYSGLVQERDDLIDDAILQIMSMHELFHDKECGLLHQARGFNGKGVFTQDHWSRGNGWAVMALAALAEDLPTSHPRFQEVRQAFTAILAACITVQDDDGMWHQELTRHDSYVETSGTGLITYALGVALQLGCAPEGTREAITKALNGYRGYIALNGAVHNCCVGCLAPNNGTIEDYMNRLPNKDDPHAFGPVILAFSQAQSLGIEVPLTLEQEVLA